MAWASIPRNLSGVLCLPLTRATLLESNHDRGKPAMVIAISASVNRVSGSAKERHSSSPPNGSALS
jgi:hypothetical protein